ncbi:MAG TPA: lysophospholipid acyltransferase family protein [Phycisphaerae bacterium]|nr:lysophospholipid acyltransferase family protein [Phycisphaerae bacterium]
MKGPRSHPNPLLRRRALPAGADRNLWYRCIRRILQVGMCAGWKVRVLNRHYEPHAGGAVYVANHQSFLDPILMSFALRRPMSYMAREDLFGVPVFGSLIRSLNAFPVRRETADTAALKEAMRRLRAGRQVVVFAEGTRTPDGRIGALLPGVVLLAQRAAEWTVPVVIDGAFEAWPRSKRLPRPGSIVVQYAPPIPQSEARKLDAAELMARIRGSLIAMQTDIRLRLRRPVLHYDRQ